MKNKKLIALAAAGVLALTGVVGGTVAYFTDADHATNIITMGHVDIELTEEWNPEDGKNVKPNAIISKTPEIKLVEGSESAYVRAKIEINGDLNETEKEELLAGINIQDGWTLSADGYYYFNTVLAKGETTPATLFTQVHIPETWNNAQADKTFNVVVTGEAIQADNFTPARNDSGMINGWFLSSGEAITAENYE